MKNFVPTDDQLRQSFGTRLKRWLAMYVTKLVDVDPVTGLEKEIPVLDLATNMDVAEALKAESEAREEALRLEAETRKAEDAEIREQVSGLQGIVTYLDGYNFETELPTQEMLTAYALEKTEWEEVKNSTSVINLFDNHEWIFNTETGEWIDYGQSTVRTATNERLGIVKGSSAAGKIAVNIDGTMTLNSVPAHVHTVDSVTSLQESLDAKAPVDSPALTGSPTAPTPATSDNSTKVATTAYVTAKVGAMSSSGSFPTPTTTAGVGQWRSIPFTTMSLGGSTTYQYTVPSGGTWAVCCTGGSGVVAGGTTFRGSGSSSFCWRIA